MDNVYEHLKAISLDKGSREVRQAAAESFLIGYDMLVEERGADDPMTQRLAAKAEKAIGILGGRMDDIKSQAFGLRIGPSEGKA